MLNLKNILKTALGVSLIYIMAVILTLFMCDRVNELESSEEKIINTTVALSFSKKEQINLKRKDLCVK